MSERRYLGPGRSYKYKARPGYTLAEEGNSVFEVSLDYFCQVCEGSGCRCCGDTGEEGKRQERNKAGKNSGKKNTRKGT